MPTSPCVQLTNFISHERPAPLRGGILADDMGLGKTLEVGRIEGGNIEGGYLGTRWHGQKDKSSESACLLLNDFAWLLLTNDFAWLLLTPTCAPSCPPARPPQLQIISLICTNRPGVAQLNYFTASDADQAGGSGAAGAAADGQQVAAAAAEGSEEGAEERRPRKRQRKGKETASEQPAATSAAAAGGGPRAPAPPHAS